MHPSIDLVSFHILNCLELTVLSPIIAAIVSENVIIKIDKTSVIGFSHQKAANIRNANGPNNRKKIISNRARKQQVAT